MEFFNKKDTLIKTITFMAMMAAINVLLSLGTLFIPFLSVILVIILPLTSALVEVLCKDRYYPIYALGTIGLSVVVTLENFDFTLFYILPSIITGYLFGLMAKKGVGPMWSILAASLAQTALNFAFIPLIKFVTGRNLIDDITSIFSIEESTGFSNLILTIFFVVSLIQIILSFIVVNNELKKLNFSHKNNEEKFAVIETCDFVSIILSIVFFFINKEISYLFIILTLYFFYFIIRKTIINHRWNKLIFYGSILFVNIFVFAVFYPLLKDGQILLIEFTPLFVAFISLLPLN